MTSSQVKSAHFSAMSCELVTIESNFMRGFTGLTLVGSNSEICKGGLLRAQAVLETLEVKIPQRKILISLYPADQKKEGNQFDLAFAVALFSLLQEEGKIQRDLSRWVFTSELGLDGHLNGVKGSISFALEALQNQQEGLIVSSENLEELKALRDEKNMDEHDFEILAFDNLKEVLLWCQGEDVAKKCPPLPSKSKPFQEKESLPQHSFDDMLLSKELAEIATAVACGGHNLFLSGTPGTGKSMFAHRLISIFPELRGRERIETLKVHSAFANKIEKLILTGTPPFRAPHHSASASAVIGSEYSPGEIVLAHNGVLFLDEFPEFRKDIIESLREPLETGSVSVSRSKVKLSWNANFILVIAANNCPCGWLGSLSRRCICPSNKILNYKRRLSGPILDRIDIHMNLNESMVDGASILTTLGLRKSPHVKCTEELAHRVLQGRKFSWDRNGEWGITCNKDLKGEHLMDAFALDKDQFQRWISQFRLKRLSNRSMLKVLRVARTLADLDLSHKVREKDLSKALSWSSMTCAKSRGDQAYGFA